MGKLKTRVLGKKKRQIERFYSIFAFFFRIFDDFFKVEHNEGIAITKSWFLG